LHFLDSGGVYGAERVILNLSREMLRSDRFEPVVGCIVRHSEDRSDLYDAAEALGVEAVKVPIANGLLFRDLPRTVRLLRSLRIGLIHSHGYKPSVYGFVVRILGGIPILATCHLWFEPSKGPLKMRVMVWIEKRIYRWFPVVVAVSEPIREVLIRHGILRERTVVICNGVEPQKPVPSSLQVVDLRRELGLTDGDFCVLTAGRLTRQKAQWLLVEAAAILKSAGGGVHFLIVGEGELVDELRAAIQKHDVADCVSLLGFRRDMPRLLAAADAFALPSLDEGMPMSLLEAAAARVPAIATPVGDVPKLIEHERTGLLVPLENALALAKSVARLRDDRAFAHDLANAAYAKMVGKYSSDAMCARYMDVYAGILAEKT
jgi:glycosyltransferase involved in cell wall biosynthesis